MHRLPKHGVYAAVMGALFSLPVSAYASEFTKMDVPSTQASGAEYWTSQRMQSALPAAMPALQGVPAAEGTLIAPSNAEPAGKESGRTSSMGRQSALLSEDMAAALALTGAFELPVASSEADVEPLSHTPPHVTFFVPTAYYGLYPYRTIGKVFFTSGGVNYVCSGSAAGNRAVLTAGHCVSNGAGSFHTNWRFAPRYLNGATPDGLWTAYRLGTFTAWHTAGNLCRDVGFAAVGNLNGQTLAQRVGYLGFAWNQSTNQTWNIFGYPAGAPFSGQYMVQTRANTSRIDSPNGCTPYTVGTGTTQTGGTSGGPRIINFLHGVAGAVNHANSVNSYIYIAHPRELFGPYFDTSVKSLRDWALTW